MKTISPSLCCNVFKLTVSLFRGINNPAWASFMWFIFCFLISTSLELTFLFIFMYTLKKIFFAVSHKLAVNRATQFILYAGAKFLIFEKLLLKTAAGTSFLCYGWKKAVFNQHWFSFSFTT